MAKDKETPEEVDELSGWKKLHQDYLERKAREEKERKEQEDKERRELLKTVPKREKEAVEQDKKPKKDKGKIPKIPFKGKKEKPEKKKANGIPKRHLLRAAPVLAGFLTLALLSAYFMSPLATQKEISISGNKEVTSEDILQNSAIKDQDYTLTTLLSRQGYERNIRQSSPWIESVSMDYRFPNRFNISVKEYDTVAYEVRDGEYHPVLTNGVVVPTASQSTDAKTSILIQFQDADKIASFVKQLEKLPASLKKAIKTVDLTPSKATPDLLTLTMEDDHKVILPLSDLDRKLAYYPSILSQLSEPSVIDMESGIYSYGQAAAAQQAEEEAKAKEENAENVEENTETSSENLDQAVTEESQ